MIKSTTCVVTLNRKSSHYMFLSVCCIYQTNMNLMLSTAPSLNRSSSPLMVCSCIPPSGPPVSQRDLRCSPQIHQGLPRWGGELHAAASADVGARPASGRPAHLNPRQLGLHVKEGCRGQGGRRGRTVRRLTSGHRWGGRGEGEEGREENEKYRDCGGKRTRCAAGTEISSVCYQTDQLSWFRVRWKVCKWSKESLEVYRVTRRQTGDVFSGTQKGVLWVLHWEQSKT